MYKVTFLFLIKSNMKNDFRTVKEIIQNPIFKINLLWDLKKFAFRCTPLDERWAEILKGK